LCYNYDVSKTRELLRRHRLPIALVIANLAFATVFVTVALGAFHQPTPHELPVGVVGPVTARAQLERSLEARAPSQLRLRSYGGEPQARAAIGRREIDGAVILAPGGPRLLIATAGGTAAAQALTRAFTAAGAQRDQRLVVQDVVPPKPGDSQALSSFFLILCVLFPSLAAGAASAHLLQGERPVWRFAVPLAAAAAIGLAVAAIGDAVSGLGSYFALAGIVALFSLAISLPTAALRHVKPHLIALAILVFLVIGVPVSGGPAGLAPFGPGVLRALDSALPLGVAAGAVRNTVYFGGHDTAGHLLVLGGWALAGFATLALLIGRERTYASS
jgi:hypothetical protein